MVRHLWPLVLACLAASATSKSVDHSDLAVYVFSNLLARNGGDSLPPFPEGLKMDLICQAAGHTTYWYERHPPDKYPDGVKDKLVTISSSPVPRVSASVYTIDSLTRKDDGRELWCTMESSSIHEVVTLTVVGQPAPLAIAYTKNSVLELECTSESVNPLLELCWYQGDEKLQCMGSKTQERSSVTTNVGGAELEKVPRLVCKPELKDQSVLDLLTEDAKDYFATILQEASVELEIEGQGWSACHDEAPESESDNAKIFTLRDPDNNQCRKVTIKEQRFTTPAPPIKRTAPQTTPKGTSPASRSPVDEEGRGSASPVVVSPLPMLLTLVLIFVS